MLKKSVLSLSLVALMGLAACGGDAEQAEVVEEQPALVPLDNGPTEVAPEAVAGTVQMDTTGAGTIVDTTTIPAAPAAQ